MNDDAILKEMKTVLHEALNRTAEAYIEEAVENFEDDLRKRKNEIVLDILNGIEMSIVHCPDKMTPDIHILFRLQGGNR